MDRRLFSLNPSSCKLPREPAKPQVGSAEQLSRRRVLVADEDPESRARLVRWLRAECYEVAEAATVAQLLARLEDSQRSGRSFDLLVVVLIRLPQASIARLIERLRRRDDRVPVIAVKGPGESELDPPQVDAVLGGPVDWDVLRMVLHMLLPSSLQREL